MKALIQFDVMQFSPAVAFYDQGLDGMTRLYVPEAGGYGRYEPIEGFAEIPDSAKFRIPQDALVSLAEEVRKFTWGQAQLDGVVLEAYKRESERVDKMLDHLMAPPLWTVETRSS